MPTQRKTTTKSTAKRKTGTSTTARKRKPAKKSDIDRRWSILLFALGALFLILAFVPGSSVWLTLRGNVLFGAFGISGWLIGPFFLYWAVLVGMEKPVFSAIIRCIVFMLALSGAALIFGKLDIAGLKFGELLAALLENGKASTVGGGLISLIFGAPVLALMGRPAAYVFIVLIVIIAAMVFTGVTPAEVVRFFIGLANRIPKREYEDYEEEEDFAGEMAAAENHAVASNASAATAAPAPRRGRKKKKAVDIDLGPETASAPGKAENDEVEIGPGGTFGMNPLGDKETPPAEYDEPILPFDPHSPQSLYDAPAPGSLTFNRSQVRSVSTFGGEAPEASPARVQPSAKFAGAAPSPGVGMPMAGTGVPGSATSFGVNAVAEAVGGTGQESGQAPGGGEEDTYGSIFAPGSVFDEPAPPVGDAEAPFDLFGNTNTPTPVQGSPTPMAGEVPGDASASANPSVQAMIAKAAEVKEEGKAEDTREQDTFVQYVYPPASLFSPSASENNAGAREEMQKTADLLVNTLASFGVQTRILDVSRGPSVTRYEIQPQTGVKISRITNLADDIALNLAAAGVRIEAPIPGKPAVGIEVPNKLKSTVSIRSILESSAFSRSESPLTIALGKDIAGESVVADLAKMPHLLVAGSTGSGKSVCINSIIMSLLYKSSPDDVRLMLIDPKVVELAEYNGIPHLLMPVVTEPRKAASALGGMVAEMEKRYHMFAENNVRDIKTFNKKAQRDGALEKMPYIAIVIDELADLMMTSGKEVEDYICRIAQKARAAGMHLIVATQRPSVDVITGLIKANIPSRIAFAVSSQVDSRTILDGAGAEKLLGMGDMLFMPVGANKPVRVQGTYVKDKEISGVIKFVKQNSGGSRYDEDFIASVESRMKAEGGASEGDGSDDSLLADETFQAAVEVALENGQISTSFLQRRLRLGYARAGRIMDQMEQMGIISQPEGSKPRQVLINRQQWLEMSMNAHD